MHRRLARLGRALGSPRDAILTKEALQAVDLFHETPILGAKRVIIICFSLVGLVPALPGGILNVILKSKLIYELKNTYVGTQEGSSRYE